MACVFGCAICTCDMSFRKSTQNTIWFIDVLLFFQTVAKIQEFLVKQDSVANKVCRIYLPDKIINTCCQIIRLQCCHTFLTCISNLIVQWPLRDIFRTSYKLSQPTLWLAHWALVCWPLAPPGAPAACPTYWFTCELCWTDVTSRPVPCSPHCGPWPTDPNSSRSAAHNACLLVVYKEICAKWWAK